MSVRTIQSYIGSATPLAILSEQVARLLSLQRTWESVAPQRLAHFCQVASLRDRTLVLYANNGAVAAKVRQLVPSLLEKFQKKGLEITAILVRVQAGSMTAVSDPPKTMRLEGCALDALRQLTERLGASPLREALEKMLERHTEQDNTARHGKTGESD